MNIIQLTAENVKRLKAVTIKPDGNIVVIAGQNGAGKSSVLDSIQYALGGDPEDKMPVRRGEEKAKVVVDLGDLIVKRTFTAAGGTALTVTNADGIKQSTPQAILDKLVGKLTFDPLAFAHLSERGKPGREEQANILRGLVGLDFTKTDSERQKLYDERTAVNREAKALEARMAAMPKHDGIPDSEVSTADILAEQEKAARQNQANESIRRQAADAQTAVDRARQQAENTAQQMVRVENEIKRLQGELSKLSELSGQQATLVSAEQATAKEWALKAAEVRDIDLAPFRTRATEAESLNRKVRENRLRVEVVGQYKAKAGQAETLGQKIDKLDADKRHAIAAAKFPIPGLSFDTAGGVTLAGIPFEQCSTAEQLKVSVAIGLALNPKLRVLLIRDGSLLDQGNLEVITKMAQDAKAQVWIERVEKDGNVSVVIEDGEIKAQP